MANDFWAPTTKRKARKEYRCVWCGEAIRVAESYIREAGRFDGEFQSNQWHPECRKAASHEDMIDGFDPYEHDRPGAVYVETEARDGE